MMTSGFESKVVIVTGASTGTGAATTRHFPVRRFGRVLQGILPLLMLPLLLLVPQMVWAHAIVLKSTPAVNAVLSGDDVPIRLRFNSRIDRARSKMTLFAPDGTQQSLTPAAESPADGLNAEAKVLAPGAWQAISRTFSI
jgi:copper resistance protein C